MGLLFGPKAQWCCLEVDAAKVDARKKSAVAQSGAGTSFVSTNDVLTSWFLRSGGFDVGFMHHPKPSVRVCRRRVHHEHAVLRAGFDHLGKRVDRDLLGDGEPPSRPFELLPTALPKTTLPTAPASVTGVGHVQLASS